MTSLYSRYTDFMWASAENPRLHATFNGNPGTRPMVNEAGPPRPAHKKKFDPGLLAFYADLGGCALVWEATQEVKAELCEDPWVRAHCLAEVSANYFASEMCGGGIRLSGLDSIKPGGQKGLDGYKLALGMCKLDGKTVDPNEFCAVDFRSSLVALLRIDASGKFADNVYLLQQEQDPWLVDMKLTLARYAECALRARGYGGWQRAYLDRKDPTFERMQHILAKVFPGERFDDIFDQSA